MMPPEIVGFNQPEIPVRSEVDVKAAAQRESRTIAGRKSGRGQAVQAAQGMNERPNVLAAKGKRRPTH